MRADFFIEDMKAQDSGTWAYMFKLRMIEKNLPNNNSVLYQGKYPWEKGEIKNIFTKH